MQCNVHLHNFTIGKYMCKSEFHLPVIRHCCTVYWPGLAYKCACTQEMELWYIYIYPLG